MNSEKLKLVFVYGTLVRGGRLSSHMAMEQYVGDYKLTGYAMYKIRGQWYPGIVPKSGSEVIGEVYEADEYLMSVLDSVEGVDYDRKTVSVQDLLTGLKFDCYTYVYNKPVAGYELIEEGIWTEKRVRLLGYGSLMNSKDFVREVNPEDHDLVKKVGNGVLRGFKLGYTYFSKSRKGGVLDVIRGAENDYVIGVVNEMPYRVLKEKFDTRENNGVLYKRELVQITIDGKPTVAYCYFILEHHRNYNGIAPNNDYNEIVLSGMKENNYPDEYIEKYLEYINKLERNLE